MSHGGRRTRTAASSSIRRRPTSRSSRSPGRGSASTVSSAVTGEVRSGTWFAYIGEFSRGRIVKGVAEMNGSIYEGGFLDNLPHGPGETSTPNGLVTKGTVRSRQARSRRTSSSSGRTRRTIAARSIRVRGPCTARASSSTPNGGVYEGEFKQDRPEGAGVHEAAERRSSPRHLRRRPSARQRVRCCTPIRRATKASCSPTSRADRG